MRRGETGRCEGVRQVWGGERQGGGKGRDREAGMGETRGQGGGKE